MAPRLVGSRIAVDGRSCWRHAHARRVGFLVDGAAYFAAFADAAERARRSLFILGWDISGGIRLRRDGRQHQLPAVLGELARERWRRATGVRLPQTDRVASDPWPPGLAAEVEDVTVAIARTEPAWRERPAVHEIEQLHLDAIARARRSIYLETQYVTAGRIAAALAARLEEPDGPEVVIVVPRVSSGWLKEATMGALRARLLRRLRDADRFGRLRVFYPTVSGLSADAHVNVHTKLLVVDDVLLR